jgi:hypothetical protein
VKKREVVDPHGEHWTLSLRLFTSRTGKSAPLTTRHAILGIMSLLHPFTAFDSFLQPTWLVLAESEHGTRRRWSTGKSARRDAEVALGEIAARLASGRDPVTGTEPAQ